MVASGRADIDEATAAKTQEKQNFLDAVGIYSQQGMNMLHQQLANSLKNAQGFKEGAEAQIDQQFNDQAAMNLVAGAKGGFSSPQNAQQTMLLANKLKAQVNVNEKVATLNQAATQGFTQSGMQVLSNVLGGQKEAAMWGGKIAQEALSERSALGKMAGQAKVQTLTNLGNTLVAASNRKHDAVSGFIAKHVSDHINYKTQMNAQEIARTNLIAGLDRATILRANDRQLTALGKVTDNIAKATEKHGDLKVKSLSKYYTDYLNLMKDIMDKRINIEQESLRQNTKIEEARLAGVHNIQGARERGAGVGGRA